MEMGMIGLGRMGSNMAQRLIDGGHQVVVYDPAKVSYGELTKLFFETHDFTQVNRQGPDIGTQYRSEIFYLNDEQKQIAEDIIEQLKNKDYDVKTSVSKATKFWSGEDYHQDYYEKNGKTPYCHIYKKIF